MSMLEELNVQSALEAERGEEERVRDALVERDKMPLVVREAALIELWREEVMPRILKMGEPETCFQVRWARGRVPSWHDLIQQDLTLE